MSTSPHSAEASASADGWRAELEAARSESVAAQLSHLGVLHFEGEDAEGFLQGQLTCEVSGLRNAATYGAYCSPKGRMLASFLLWRSENGFLMALPREIGPAVLQRFGRFVLRSKVKISDAAGRVALFGCSGPAVQAALRSLEGSLPDHPLQLIHGSGESVIRLDESRFLLAVAADKADARLQKLSAALKPVGAPAWQWLDIRRGIPWITPATQEQLVPQMANLELLGGVSFTKGCYTGQEIVARTQHLGKVKRRMFLANVADPAAAGDDLYAEDLGEQASGTVVNAGRSPDGGWDLLAVVPVGSHERSGVHLKSLEGPRLRFLPLPYPAA